MLFTLKDYESIPRTIKFADFQHLHSLMQEEIGEDEEALELYFSLVEIATDYARIRSQWSIYDREWKIRNDEFRTHIHDSLIIRFNVLARYLQSIGKEAVWRKELGDEKRNPENRKCIGDFGCYLAFVHGLSTR